MGLAVGLLVAALLAEVAVRIVDHRPPIPPEGKRSAPQGMYIDDPVVGVRTAPSFEYADEKYSTNSHGFRDRERAYGPAPEGTLRIVVLGDSYTAGVGVDDAQHYSALLEAALPAAQQDGERRPVEVWNLGIPHYGVERSMLLLRERWDRIQPDVVVLSLFQGNDPIDDLHGPDMFAVVDGHIARGGWLPGANRDYSARRAKLNRPPFARGVPGDGLLFRYSFAYRRILRSISSIREAEATSWPWGMQPFDYEAFGAVAWLYLVPEPPPVTGGWELTFDALGELATLTEENGARLIVTSIPAKVSIDRGALTRALERGWQHGVSDEVEFDVQQPERRVVEGVEAMGLPLVRFADDLHDALEGDEEPYYSDDSHWTAVGHRVAAAAIGRELGRLEILPGLDAAALDRELLVRVPPGSTPTMFSGGFRPRVAGEWGRFGDAGGKRDDMRPRDDDDCGDPMDGPDGDRPDVEDGGRDRAESGKGGGSEIMPRLVEPDRLVPLLPEAPPGWIREAPIALVGPLEPPLERVWIAMAQATYVDPQTAQHRVRVMDSAGQPEVDSWWRTFDERLVAGPVSPGVLPTSARFGLLVEDGHPELLSALDRSALEALEAELRPDRGARVAWPTLVAGGNRPPAERRHFLRDPADLSDSLPKPPPGWELLDLMPMYRPHGIMEVGELAPATEELLGSAEGLRRDGEPWTSQVKGWYRGPAGSFALVVQDTGLDARLLGVRTSRLERAWASEGQQTDAYGSTLERWAGRELRGFRSCRPESHQCKVTVALVDHDDPEAPLARFNVILMGPPGATDEDYDALIEEVRRPR